MYPQITVKTMTVISSCTICRFGVKILINYKICLVTAQDKLLLIASEKFKSSLDNRFTLVCSLITLKCFIFWIFRVQIQNCCQAYTIYLVSKAVWQVYTQLRITYMNKYQKSSFVKLQKGSTRYQILQKIKFRKIQVFHHPVNTPTGVVFVSPKHLE